MNDLDIELFREHIYEVVRMIPAGRATSYGAIARALGRPAHSRLVGRLMAQCSNAGVPAHRVVNSSGYLTGSPAFGAPGTMQSLLEAEGINVQNNKIKEWRRVFWDPLSEIKF